MLDLNQYSSYANWQVDEQSGRSLITVTIPRNAGHPTLESIETPIRNEMHNENEFRVGDQLFKATRIRTTLKSMKSIIEIEVRLLL